jgi:hypothetical protein
VKTCLDSVELFFKFAGFEFRFIIYFMAYLTPAALEYTEISEKAIFCLSGDTDKQKASAPKGHSLPKA